MLGICPHSSIVLYRYFYRIRFSVFLLMYFVYDLIIIYITVFATSGTEKKIGPSNLT